jgi:hypothetical protein
MEEREGDVTGGTRGHKYTHARIHDIHTREKHRERNAERETQRETQREKHRERNRERETEREKQRGRNRERETEREKQRERKTQREREKHRERERETQREGCIAPHCHPAVLFVFGIFGNAETISDNATFLSVETVRVRRAGFAMRRPYEHFLRRCAASARHLSPLSEFSIIF